MASFASMLVTPLKKSPTQGYGSLLTLFQAAFGLSIAFSASVEGSVVEMKPTAPVPENNVVSPKA